MNEISLWLDSYDDIYSDFDSRHYLKRRISEDLINELRMAFRYKHEQPEAIALLLPAEKRNRVIEEAITASIKEQLSERTEKLEEKIRKGRTQALVLSAAGLLVMLIDSVIVYKAGPGYVSIFAKVILEPAGWFMIWKGLDILTYDYRETKKEKRFYKAIQQLHFYFKDV